MINNILLRLKEGRYKIYWLNILPLQWLITPTVIRRKHFSKDFSKLDFCPIPIMKRLVLLIITAMYFDTTELTAIEKLSCWEFVKNNGEILQKRCLKSFSSENDIIFILDLRYCLQLSKVYLFISIIKYIYSF